MDQTAGNWDMDSYKLRQKYKMLTEHVSSKRTIQYYVKGITAIHMISKLVTMTTPHEHGVKLVQFALVLYLPLLLFLALSPPSSACKLIACVDRSHTCGRSSVEINHIKDCRLSFGNAWAITDRYVLAHLLGWAIKAVILPHPLLLWSSSVMFELVEMILVPFIPSLAECWWDSLLMDIFGCNALGIFFGLACCNKPTTQIKTNVLTALHCLIILLAITMTDINTFLLKHAFSICSTSPLLVVRVAFYASLAFFALTPYRTALCQGVFYSRLPAFYTISLCTELLTVYLVWQK